MKTTIQNVINRLIDPVGRLTETVDSLYYGNPQAEVSGIVTAFMPTQRVLERALELNANLVIAHEGPFFQHKPPLDSTYGDDPVFAAKKKFILDSGLSIFRFHDYWHRYPQDGIMLGLIEALAWDTYVQKHEPAYSVMEIPATSVIDIANYLKKTLDIPCVRVGGEMDTLCSRVGLLAGYRGGGQLVIPLMEQENLDLVVYGEGPEWETPEYVRDAVWQGRSKALIVLGHAESEEPGMKLLADLLQRQFPEIPVHFVREKPVFQWI
ncbi:Nif3-like dinuclear metal center hexameric protein [Paenibacillus abyssi]|uniref:GTP cyclohydrolase 1 type 2 homolog n=1 Tax=Paenibacillus abyssi TaxID=1340531 RepID=A0A917FSI4_9BACL|nr:Nif3-like dinuclear metal center hexameric protein [Paenibacillus abyssi]GGG04390.1 hypothetical protein GCM10010916_21760 [Paenibacillus abyssi]